MASPLLLEGHINQRDEVIAVLRRKLEGLQAENRRLTEAVAANSEGAQQLQSILSPLYRALQQIFGELNEMSAGSAGSENHGPVDRRWEDWKTRMPGRPAEAIDLLLTHQSMSVKQFMAALHCGKDAVYQVMSKLGQAGVVQNNGGRYSLKD